VYLGFPADPWQHFARLNEWSWHELVTQHSYWKKSSYFFGYSLIGHVGLPSTQLKCFDVFYTGCCLLLCWQYHRLARAVGLGEKASLLFVLLNALTFGNNIFGFYRYYGMSSTVFAQLGAVAITRIALEAMRVNREDMPGSPRSPSGLSRFPSLFAFLPSPAVRLLQFAPAFGGALLITIGNHFQGVLIAGAGIAAVITWRLIEWRRSMIAWLLLAAVAVNVATVLWWPRHPMVDSIYLPHGWMTRWYAFKLFDLSSPAFERAWVIIGATGGLNLLASLWLLRRNHVVAWLTLMPVVLLLLPCFALPFANLLARSTDWESGYIIAFHRLLLAIPAGLAIAAAVGPPAVKHRPSADSSPQNPNIAPRGVFTAVFAALLALTLLPVKGTSFNRFFNTVMVPPADLAMKSVLNSNLVREMHENQQRERATDPSLAPLNRDAVLATPGISYVLNATGLTQMRRARKGIIRPIPATVASFAESVIKVLPTLGQMPLHRAEFPASTLFSPQSQTAALSGHWLPTEVAQEFSTQAELFAPIAVIEQLPQIWIQWTSPRDHVEIFAKGAGRDLATRPVDDRGRLDSGKDNQVIRVNDTVIFKPVMRTFNNGGLRLVLTITGPGLSVTHPLERTPVPLGGVQWIHNDYPVTLNAPGRYDIEITGTSLWPTATATVRYHFIVQP
jgi:hypothetical protein